MGNVYQVYDQAGLYFITNTVHQWVDVFTREAYVLLLLESIRYCQEHKGLLVYEWVIMSNHMHLIISSREGNLSDIIRDFKKFTARQIVQAIAENPFESRKRWLLWLFRKHDGGIVFWREGYHAKEISSPTFYKSKMNYIHQNPVRAGIVMNGESYLYSSCADRYGVRNGFLTLEDL